MKRWACGAILLLLAACMSRPEPPLNIVVSHANTQAEALPHAEKFCARRGRAANFNSMVGAAFQFDCVKRRP